MGFDSGFLHDRHSPALAYKPGDPDWGGLNWLQPTDPERWIKYSVVWYSQRVIHALGIAQIEHYAIEHSDSVMLIFPVILVRQMDLIGLGSDPR